MIHAVFRTFRGSLPGALIAAALRYSPRFSGRARRTELITVLGFSLIAGTAFSFLITLASPGMQTILAVPLIALIGFPVFDVILRRLHDTGRDGLSMFVILIPYIGWVWFGFLLLGEGDAGENAFGPEPV